MRLLAWFCAVFALVSGLVAVGPFAPIAAAAPATAPPPPDELNTSFDYGGPLFTWSAVSGATGYQVQWSNTADYASAQTTSTTATRYAPPARLAGRTVHWRVATRTSSGLGDYSADSTGSSDSIQNTWDGAPIPVSPLGSDGAQAELNYPTDAAIFRWKTFVGAQTYNLEIDDDQNFTSPLRFTTVNRSYTLASPQSAEKTFYWRVRASLTDSSLVSDWSTRQAYRYRWTAKPELRPVTDPEPNDNVNASPRDIRLSWKPLIGATSYYVQVSPNANFTNNTIPVVTTNATSYEPPKPFASGAYFWRVQAVDSANNFSAWSERGSFTRGWANRPAELTPNWNAEEPDNVPVLTAGRAGFSWTAIPHASQYRLEVSSDNNFSESALVFACYTNHTSWASYRRTSQTGSLEPNLCGSSSVDGYTALTPGNTYFWRVRGVDAGGSTGGNANVDRNGNNLSPWSTGRTGPGRFIYLPNAPQPTRPARGAQVVVPTMAWSGHGASFILEVKDDTGTTILKTTTTAHSYTPGNSLPAGHYTWRVSSSPSAPAAAQDFNVVQSDVASSTLTPIAPTEEASLRSPPQFVWSTVAGAATYRVFIKNDATATPIELARDLHYPTFTATTLPTNATDATYTWWVESYDASNVQLPGSRGRSASSQFAITSELLLGTDDYLAPTYCPGEPTQCVPQGDTPRFEWRDDPKADFYILTVARDPYFSSVLSTYQTTSSSLTPRESFVDNQAGSDSYYWFVRPCVWRDSSKRESRCGPQEGTATASDALHPDQTIAASFRKHSVAVETLPVLATAPASSGGAPGETDVQVPTDGKAGDQVTFRWRDYFATESDQVGDFDNPPLQEAMAYRIEIASEPLPTARVLETATVKGTSYTIPLKALPEGSVYWRVLAIDGSNNDLTWSDDTPAKTNPYTVTKLSAAPTGLCSSDSDESDGDCASGLVRTRLPRLTWTPARYAASYDIELAKGTDDQYDDNFADKNLIALPSAKGFSAVSPTVGLGSGRFSWHVRSVSAGGAKGPWSSTAHFELAPEKPAQSSPADNTTATSSNILFTWAAVSGAGRYRLTLSSPKAATVTQDTVSRAWVPTTTIADGRWEWTIQAYDGSNKLLSTSPTRSFVKDGTAPQVTSRPTTIGVGITAPQTLTFSEPVKGASSASLRITIAGTSTSIPVQVGTASAPATTTATITPTVPLMPGQSYTLSTGPEIVDDFGNSLVAYSSTFTTDKTVDNASPAVTEVWSRQSTSAASGSSYDLAKTSGSNATLRFNGTNVSVLGTGMPTGGYARVILDGATKTSTASFYASRLTYRKSVWSITGLKDGPHTLQVVVMGTKPSGSTGTWVALDAFKIGQVVTEQTSGSVREYFRRSSNASASAGSYDSSPHTTTRATGRALPFYEVKFRGTGVLVYGVRSASSGSANVSIDGDKSTVVSFNGTTAYGVQLYSSPTLINKEHTMRIYVAGTKNGANSNVGLDHILIR